MFVFIGITLVMVLSLLWSGFVASVLWNWFITPLGVMPLTYWHAIGLMCLAAALGFVSLNTPESYDKSFFESLKSVVMKTFGFQILLLVIGWCVHDLMI